MGKRSGTNVARYNKNKIISKYVRWYGNPVRFNNNYYYLTESPQLQFKYLSMDKVHLYYSACVLGKAEVDKSVPDERDIIDVAEYEMLWKIHDCFINARGWFYDSDIDGDMDDKRKLVRVEDACDWENPLIVRGGV